MTKYDVIILGGGGAGIAAAEGAKAAGAKRICIVEPGELGGECPNRACVPTKAMLASAKLYRTLQSAREFGVRTGRVSFSFKEIMQRKEKVREAIIGGDRLGKYLKMEGVEVMKGRGVFEDPHTIRVAAKVLTGKSIIVATGTVDAVPPIAGLETSDVLSYADVVELPRLPDSIAIIGGGPVGCEFATFFASLGVKTTILQHADHLLAREEEELSLLAEASLRHLGATIHVKTKTLGLRKERKGTRVTYQVGRRPRQYLTVEAVLLAAGKRPNIEGLGLELAKVKKGKDGKVLLNSKLQTSAKHILFAGDVSGRLMFTHTAHYEGFVAGWNAVQPKASYDTDLSVIPRVTFIEPELASVGLTQTEALQAGHKTAVYRAPLNLLARSAIEGKQEGLLKVIVDQKSDLILGAHMFGERAGEVIHELALAMRHGLPLSAVRSGIRAYPTYSEAISALSL